MEKKRDFQLYTVMWLAAVLILIVLLWQNVGDARIINYSGIVRGATQKLVKEELNGQPDDILISRLDGIIYDLQTGKGDYNLSKNKNKDYQNQLSDLKLIWENIKKEIPLVRAQNSDNERLFALSQQHFDAADRMVLCAEQNSNNKLIRFIIFYCLSLIFSVTVFALVNRRSRKALKKSNYTDRLTGILNRTGFEHAAEEVLRQHPGTKYTIIEFDIDNFKSINNFYGYALGDQLLFDFAAAISKWQNQDQLCARIDADDFVVLVKQSNNMIPELEKVLNQVAREHAFLESFGGVTFTFGAYQIKHNSELIKTIMDKANTAHKTAKLQEHTSPVWYDEHLLEKLNMERRFKEQMHHALIEEEFKMYLQPKLDLSTMKVIGAEALVRWELPGYGIVYPDSYIPVFEKNGSIADLDFYMLKKACLYLKNLLHHGISNFCISVNFSRVTLYQRAFYETFLEIVNQYEIPHHCIELEVTESAFNEVADSVIQILSHLKEDGFTISMDDFGAGYSSLNILSKLPIQIIKLDREFLKAIHHTENGKAIIACAVELAHAMGTKIICEGVELAEHVQFLQKIGCDYGQGYYFSRPISQKDFAKKYHSVFTSTACPL